MDADELKKKNREFVEHWRRWGPILEEIKRRERLASKKGGLVDWRQVVEDLRKRDEKRNAEQG